MELVHVFAILLFFLHCELSVLSQTIITGTVRVLHQHPGIKSCAAAVLQQNNLLGGRVSNVTGVCEGLSYHWGLNQTYESGYAYVKKISVQQKYQPPVRVEQSKYVTWRIPGILSPESKVDMTFAAQSKGYGFTIHLDFQTLYSERPCGDCHRIEFIMRNKVRYNGAETETVWLEMVLSELHAGKKVNEEAKPVELILEKQRKYFKMKFTFQVQTDVFKFLLDGRNMTTLSLQTLDPKTIKYVYASATYFTEAGAYVHLHDFVFTEG